MGELTHQYLTTYLHYNPESGEFAWIEKTHKQSQRCKVGEVFNPKPNTDGYLVIGINGRNYRAHRLAWFYVYGEWPKQMLDHINGNRTDNRLCNLRDVSRRDNANNKESHRRGKLPGCYFRKSTKKWMSRVRIENKQYYIGIYSTEKEAHEAYNDVINNIDAFLKTKGGSG